MIWTPGFGNTRVFDMGQREMKMLLEWLFVGILGRISKIDKVL